MADFSLGQFAAILVGSAATLEHHKHESLEKAAKIVEAEAKSYPGSYQAGWPPLKPETVARKATGDSPLLETGELRDSYGHTVQGHSDAYIGSNNDKAVWHELGTVHIPPRPILSTAAIAKEKEVVHILGHNAFKGLITK